MSCLVPDIREGGALADSRQRAKEWVRSGNNEKHAWAIRYLASKGVLSRQRNIDESNGDFLLAEFENASYSDSYVGTLTKMKRAWSQKKVREGGGKLKPYSFMLTKRFGSALKRLSKRFKTTRREALEKVVMEYDAISGSEAWLDLGRKSLARRLDDAKKMVEEQAKKSKALEHREGQLNLRESALRNIEVYESLVYELYADYEGMVKAQSQGGWVVTRRVSKGFWPPLYDASSLQRYNALMRYRVLSAKLDR